ncbi:hypothetical protein, partial [Chroococcidiopsis sp.]|uniref:hypothetical protein n=1 Tax=Chroococcidiopsis sp. TaxID=3088168 RepID=UPI003F3D2235
DLEIAKARVRQKINNRRLTLLTTQDNQSNSQQIEENETCAPTQIDVHGCTVPCADAQPCAPTQIDVHPCTVPCADAQGHNIDRARANTLSNSSKLDLKTTNKSVVGSKEIDLENEPEGSYQADEEIFAQLRKLGIKLNTTVRKIVTSHRPNVSDAIAHLQERLTSGESFKCLEAAFVTACKEASKPERINAPPVELPQPDPSHLELLETAKRNGSISGYYSSPYKDGRTILVDDCVNRCAMVWWEYLQLDEELEEVEF